MSVIVNPFHRALLAVHVHRLSLRRVIADVAQRVRDASRQLDLVLDGRVDGRRVERRRGEEFS